MRRGRAELPGSKGSADVGRLSGRIRGSPKPEPVGNEALRLEIDEGIETVREPDPWKGEGELHNVSKSRERSYTLCRRTRDAPPDREEHSSPKGGEAWVPTPRREGESLPANPSEILHR